MVTLYVVTTLSLVGLPMLNSFVGEFLVLSGSLQTGLRHHAVWTVLATTGVILSAAYMLLMIQRVFYGHNGVTADGVAPRDLNAREQLSLWPLVALMLVMGVASSFWFQTLDSNATALATRGNMTEPAAIPTRLESESYPKPAGTPFVDPQLKNAALNEQERQGGQPATHDTTPPSPSKKRF